MSARTHTQRCPSRTSAPSLSPPPPDVLICSCAHPHPPHTHPPRTALSAPSHTPAPSHALADHPPQGSHELHASTSAVHTSSAPSHAITANHPHLLAFAPPVPASVRLPAVVLRPLAFSFLQSNSNFDVSLPNLSKRCEGATVPAVAANGRRISASRNWESISNFVVSLPNVSEKNVKGLLFRKQPRTGACFRLSEIGKAFQTLSSAYRT